MLIAELENSRGRPRTIAVKKLIGFNETQLSAINKWRASQSPVPNLTEAIRRLLAIALEITPLEK
jgi:hypothetical protein